MRPPRLRFSALKPLVSRPCHRMISSTRALLAEDPSPNSKAAAPPSSQSAKPLHNPRGPSSLQASFLNDLISKNITSSAPSTPSRNADSNLASMIKSLERTAGTTQNRRGTNGVGTSQRSKTLADLESRELEMNLRRRLGRRWKAGDVYSPHDLSPEEQYKWAFTRAGNDRDVFQVMRKNPLDFYKNFTVLSEFISETGRIKHSRITGLRPKSQRKIAKAIRRAVGIGLLPSVHKHPLLLGPRDGIHID